MKRRRVHAWRKVVRQVQQENGGQRRTISLSNHVSLEPNQGQVLLSVLSTYCHLEPNSSLLGTATSTSPQLPNPLFNPFIYIVYSLISGSFEQVNLISELFNHLHVEDRARFLDGRQIAKALQDS